MPLQPSYEPVDVSAWERHEDFGIFPTGTKPKQLLICPQSTSASFLVPGKAYMLKTPTGWRRRQAWSEVIAYRLARVTGIEVPPCHIAVDDQGNTGALIEFFYDYPVQRNTVRVIHGADLLNLVRRPTDGVRPHDVATNIRALRALRIRDAQDWWAKTITFDALIGNTDRHMENWGAKQISVGALQDYAFTPVYDNGTSLAYEFDEQKLVEFWKNPNKIEAYIDGGRHDCGVTPNEDGPLPHMFLCKRFIEEYPASSAAMANVIRFDKSQVDQIVNDCAEFRVPERFTPERARFVSRLIDARRARLHQLFGD